jgi:predicted DCC family thiol-disulfide oxidoreductase YuxK
MPDKPLVIFDGHCGFCRIWIQYWTQLTGDAVQYAPSQQVRDQFPEIPPENFSHSVHLVLPEGNILSGARAVFTTLTYATGTSWSAWAYDHVPGFAPISEALYRFIAAHRSLFYQLTRFSLGTRISPLHYASVEWLFLRMLAAIYFTAFVSLATQVTGLIGARGILPSGRYLDAVFRTFGPSGFWQMPTLFWIAHGDAALLSACIAGSVIAAVLFFGFLERLSLICLYVLYLSLCTAGQEFLSYQWDMLLLEAGFLAIFLGSSKWIVFLFRWLVFRLMFLSGAVKLMSHDVSWRNLTALSFHYFTQPLPTPVAWYMNQVPLGFHRFSTAVVLFIEVLVPFLIFAPRRWRLFAAGCLITLQTLMFLTGNYTFFNFLTIALCLFLLDDSALARLPLRRRSVRTRPGAVLAIALVVIVLSAMELSGMLFEFSPEPLNRITGVAAPFGIVNTYGLFAVMTTSRPEIIVQGSNDGIRWLDYEFPFKPGDPRKPPRWAAPHQPRLDWQMWFAALSGYRGAPWFGNFLVRLLQGPPEVAGLLARNPFSQAPPKYVRALLFDYSFTDFATRRATGESWRRVPRGLYFRQISLDDVQMKQ